MLIKLNNFSLVTLVNQYLNSGKTRSAKILEQIQNYLAKLRRMLICQDIDSFLVILFFQILQRKSLEY